MTTLFVAMIVGTMSVLGLTGPPARRSLMGDLGRAGHRSRRWMTWMSWRSWSAGWAASSLTRAVDGRVGVAELPHRTVALGVIVGVVVLPIVVWLLGPSLALFGTAMVVVAVLAWLRRAARRQVERSVAQLPDLVRVLANATEAGLSLRGAWSTAMDALDDPLRPILQRVGGELELGATLGEALEPMRRSLPGDDVGFLVTTLVVQQRSGGDVVTALRRMAVTLSERAEIREEVRTQLGSASASAGAVVALGVGSVFMAIATGDGVWTAMTTTGIGQLAIVSATALYLLGFWLIGRISRVAR